jgi:hypothetical protein
MCAWGFRGVTHPEYSVVYWNGLARRSAWWAPRLSLYLETRWQTGQHRRRPAEDIDKLFPGMLWCLANPRILALWDNARLAGQMEGKCGLNPPAEASVVGQAGEVEPDESDEVSQG